MKKFKILATSAAIAAALAGSATAHAQFSLGSVKSAMDRVVGHASDNERTDATERTSTPNRAKPAVGGRKSTTKTHAVPSDALGLCQDGTYVSTGSKQTACAAHGGMDVWYLDGTPND